MTGLDEAVLAIDGAAEIARIESYLRASLRALNRRGLVVAVSGGIDSSVSAALAVRAIGAARVTCLSLPERDGSPAARARVAALIATLGAPLVVHDITSTLDAIGCYAERDAAVRAVFPEYTPAWQYKIAITGGLEGRYNRFQLVVRRPGAAATETRPLPADQFFALVAATNYKQRVRKTIEYARADRLNYAVVGTPNRLEYDQGFFVKNGDGSADLKPIAHLYKSQVYALARALALPDAICRAEPTADTYSLPQGQDEFFFALPYREMDYALWARNHGVPAETLAAFLAVSPERAARIYRDIDVKRAATRYLHERPLLAEPVPEVHA